MFAEETDARARIAIVAQVVTGDDRAEMETGGVGDAWVYIEWRSMWKIV